MIKRRLGIVAATLAVSFLALFGYLDFRAEQNEADREEDHLVRPYGVRDFDQVTPALLRGAQPPPESYPQLKQLGVGIVVSFRREAGQVEEERRIVEGLGMRFVNIPLSGTGAPTNQQVAEFLELVHSNSGQKIFVHCKAGHDRTGVMVATFRMAMQDWTSEQVLEEMELHHYDADLDPDSFLAKWYRNRWGLARAWQECSSRLFGREPLKVYVENFPQQLQTDPSLRSLRPAFRKEKSAQGGAGGLQ